jgi:hypothetical protein
MSALFESERHFRLWWARVGHGLLLLRSTKSDERSTRIDVLFKPVSVVKLRTSLDGLLVWRASAEEVTEIEREVGPTDPRETTFLVKAGEFRGYVVAASCAWHEDDGEHDDPSYFPE